MVMNMPGWRLIQMTVRAVTHLIFHLNRSVRNMVFVHQEIPGYVPAAHHGRVAE